MKIVGREKERAEIKQYYDSGTPEFLVLYGRRRVGKTFLIREYFGGNFDFYVTGLANGKKEEQLWAWNMAIRQYSVIIAPNGIINRSSSAIAKKPCKYTYPMVLCKEEKSFKGPQRP